jgi:hypothetical protein
MQLLRDNLTLWTSEGGEDDDDEWNLLIFYWKREEWFGVHF